MSAFQSTLPARGSDPAAASEPVDAAGFQSTLPARGSDGMRRGDGVDLRPVSIHAPREGERLAKFTRASQTFSFQSTLPARGSDQGRAVLLWVR